MRLSFPILHRSISSLLVPAAFLLTAPALHAVLYDWGSATTGGNYSTTTNWTPNSAAGGPGSADSANLIDATANRVITVDASAAATLGTLTVNQSSAFTNTLDVIKAFTITNLVALGAAAGTEELRVSPSTAAFNTTLTGGLTLSSGGLFSLGFGNPNTNSPTISGGAITISGGTLLIRDGVAGSSWQATINNTTSMSAGALSFASTASGADARVRFNTNFAATGGAISILGAGNAQLVLGGATNSFGGTTTLGLRVSTSLDTGTQALSGTVAYNDLILRGTGAGLVKTISTSATGQNLGGIQFINSANAGSTTLRLASNLTLRTGSLLPAAQNFGGQGGSSAGTVSFGIDTDGNTLDLTANTGSYTPNLATNTTTIPTNYNFTSTTGTGTIKANTFTLSSATQVNVGANVVLEATNAASGSTLSGGGTIDPASTYRWSGGTTSSAVHTLTSTRTLGNLEVKTGILSLSSGATIAAASTVNVGNSASTDQNAVIRFTSGGTYANAFDLSKSPQLITSSATNSPRNRIEVTGVSQTLNLTGSILVGQTGTVANLPSAGASTVNRRAEFNAVDATSVLNLTGLISQNTGGTAASFAGININGSSGGLGSVRLANTGNSFTGGVTVTLGTLIIGGNAPSGSVGVLGNSAGAVILADGGTAITATVSALTDGAFTVGRGFTLSNGAGSAPIASYVLGSTFAGNSNFTGPTTSASSTGNKTLTVTQVAGGTSTFSGSISANPDATGVTNVTKTGLGEVVLSNASNPYDGATTVSAGTLTISGAISGTTQVNVNAGTLMLGASNVINNAASVALGGGTFATGGFSEGNASTVGLGSLILNATSTLDFGAGTGSQLLFAGVGAHTGVLTILNWQGNGAGGGASDDRLLFVGQVADFNYAPSDVSFNGVSGYAAIQFDATHFEVVAIPEPSSTALLGAVALLGLVGFRERGRLFRGARG